MAIDGLDDDFAPPRKWLDKKKYVRVDPGSGQPQLIRVEPIVTEDGEFLPDKVLVFIDEDMQVMPRDAAETLIETLNCSPLETAAHFKNYWTH